MKLVFCVNLLRPSLLVTLLLLGGLLSETTLAQSQSALRGGLLKLSADSLSREQESNEEQRVRELMRSAHEHARTIILNNPDEAKRERSCVAIGSFRSVTQQLAFELRTASGANFLKQNALKTNDIEELSDIGQNLMTYCSKPDRRKANLFDEDREANLDDEPLAVLVQTIRAETLLSDLMKKLESDGTRRKAAVPLEAGLKIED